MVMSSLTWARRRYWRYITSTDSRWMDCFQNEAGLFNLFVCLWVFVLGLVFVVVFLFVRFGFFLSFFFLLCSLISSPLVLPSVWGTSSKKHVSSRRWTLLPEHRCSITERNETFGGTLATLGPSLLLPFFVLLINCW